MHAGHSIKYFAEKNQNPKSTFIGLDSFEGLPENWGPFAKGTFDTKGETPKTDDPRIVFIKGWFQNSWDKLEAKLSNPQTLIVHYDADLYSSTLFALTKINSLKIPYIAIFDEFGGHEARALYNYLQACQRIGVVPWKATCWRLPPARDVRNKAERAETSVTILCEFLVPQPPYTNPQPRQSASHLREPGGLRRP